MAPPSLVEQVQTPSPSLVPSPVLEWMLWIPDADSLYFGAAVQAGSTILGGAGNDTFGFASMSPA